METFSRFTGEVSSDVRFATQWDRPVKDESEHPSLRSQTEMAYVPPQIQIMEMMDAGARLQAMRRARFDSSELGAEDKDEDIPLDPTRNPGVDIVDVKRAADAAAARLVESAGKKKEAADIARGVAKVASVDSVSGTGEAEKGGAN